VKLEVSVSAFRFKKEKQSFRFGPRPRRLVFTESSLSNVEELQLVVTFQNRGRCDGVDFRLCVFWLMN